MFRINSVNKKNNLRLNWELIYFQSVFLVPCSIPNGIHKVVFLLDHGRADVGLTSTHWIYDR